MLLINVCHKSEIMLVKIEWQQESDGEGESWCK